MSCPNPNGFDALAGIYDWLARAVYGNALRRAQSCFLSSLPQHAAVLVVGGGSGWFLEQLLLNCNPSRVLYVELSPKMLEKSKARIQKNCPSYMSRCEFVCESGEAIAEISNYDIVITHCFLDMFDGPQLHALMLKLKDALHPDGVWYFSDFKKAPKFPMAWISRLLIWIMYRIFRLTCKIPARQLPDFMQYFKELGCKVGEEQYFFRGMIQSSLLRRGNLS